MEEGEKNILMCNILEFLPSIHLCRQIYDELLLYTLCFHFFLFKKKHSNLKPLSCLSWCMKMEIASQIAVPQISHKKSLETNTCFITDS